MIETKPRNSTRKGRPLERPENRVSRLSDGFDVPDWKDSPNYRAALQEIRSFVDNIRITTIAGLSRRFPQHVPILESILKDLKDARALDYSEFKPAPTRITAGNDSEKIRDIGEKDIEGWMFNNKNLGIAK